MCLKFGFPLLLSTALLVACSSGSYILSTHDGRLIATDTKPSLNRSAGVYLYTDSQGQQQSIPQSQVQEIIKR
ncbi:YgdI/YgdR family lipoprotein [Ferrimonas pelagia]|uniref:Lipoprotein YgdI/YgdR-like SH3-like domain-containing protein n=1 Tax=Ferrimonas pelagia TaxID=1177826 RepID=A0ABP9EGN7_9GAMM